MRQVILARGLDVSVQLSRRADPTGLYAQLRGRIDELIAPLKHDLLSTDNLCRLALSDLQDKPEQAVVHAQRVLKEGNPQSEEFLNAMIIKINALIRMGHLPAARKACHVYFKHIEPMLKGPTTRPAWFHLKEYVGSFF